MNNIDKHKKEISNLDKNLVVYKRMQQHILKDLTNLKRIFKENNSPVIMEKVNKKEQSLYELNSKINDIGNRIENLNNNIPLQTLPDSWSSISTPTELEPELNDMIHTLQDLRPFEKKIEQLNKIDEQFETENEEKKDIKSNLELIKLQKEKEEQMILLRKQNDMKKEVEKQKLKKEILSNKKNINDNKVILKKENIVSLNTENDGLKKEIEKNIYIELKKKELELKNYQNKLKQDEDSKINDVIEQVRQENRLELDQYEQIFQKRDIKIKTALNHLNQLGSQLNSLTRTKNPNTLKFAIHKTLNEHKLCFDILSSLINGEKQRFVH